MNVEADTTSTGAWKRGEKNVYPKKSMKRNRMRERTSSISKSENVTALSLINGVMLDGQPNWRKTQQRPYFTSIYKHKMSADRKMNKSVKYKCALLVFVLQRKAFKI